MNLLNKVVADLEKVEGLKVLGVISKKYKGILSSLEEGNNLGMIECLNKEHTLLLAHNSNFRQPVSEIVKRTGETLIFPPVPFPEVRAENVVSSSPSLAVHNWLLNEFNLALTPTEATLLVGFNNFGTDKDAENNNFDAPRT
ncbi:MAG: hypothetical protein AABX65_01185 [Nanoarchaeota archaeon]